MSSNEKERFDTLLREAIEIIEETKDNDIPELLGDGILDEFLQSIGPIKDDADQTPYEYLEEYKNRLSILALIRHAIHNNYSIKGIAEGITAFVSPDFRQWYKDGVMFLQGKEKFQGVMGLYKNSAVKFAVAARDFPKVGNVGPEYFKYLDIEEYRQLGTKINMPTSALDIDNTISKLESLLDAKKESESSYQAYFEENPWVLGLQYSKIQSHIALDDKRIPDFTGVRARDGSRDVLEIKQPFIKLFKSNGQFRSEFLQAWQQAEDYLEFVTTEERYLNSRKGLRFENSNALLILGQNLSKDNLASIRRKEKMNPRIVIMTYNDILAMAKNTAELVKNLNSTES